MNDSAQRKVTIEDVLYTALTVQKAHGELFPKYKNIHQGKDVVLVGSGPSLNRYTKPIENAVHVGLNKAFKYDAVAFDYMFLQDYLGCKDYIEAFCQYDCQKFLGIVLDFWPQCIIPESIALRHGITDRYYVAHPDKLSRPVYDISSSIFWDHYSVAFPAMQFILWTNPKRIYVVGCDCTPGYFDNKDGSPYKPENLVNGWKRIKDFAQTVYPETEIISVNPVGLKGIFSDIEM